MKSSLKLTIMASVFGVFLTISGCESSEETKVIEQPPVAEEMIDEYGVEKEQGV